MDKIEITHELLAKLKEAAQEANNYENPWGFAVAVEYMNTCTPALILSLISSYEKLEKDTDAARYSEANESGKMVRLEREADWLAEQASLMCDCIENCDECRLFLDCQGQGSKEVWRNAARKALDGIDDAMEAEQGAREI